MHLYFFAGNCTENLSRKTGGQSCYFPVFFPMAFLFFSPAADFVSLPFSVSLSILFSSLLRGNEEKKIVCFGDSLTSCGGKNGRYSDMLQKSLPSYIFINSGKGGDTIGGGLARLETAVLKHRAGYLIIGLGANDYWQQKRSLYELKQDYDTILARCYATGMKIVIISCFGNEKLPPDVMLKQHR